MFEFMIRGRDIYLNQLFIGIKFTVCIKYLKVEFVFWFRVMV